MHLLLPTVKNLKEVLCWHWLSSVHHHHHHNLLWLHSTDAQQCRTTVQFIQYSL